MEQLLAFSRSLDLQGHMHQLWQILKKWVAFAFGQLALYRARVRQRRELAEMSDRLLEDIGISRAEALGEAEKPFWR
ncbi:MAG: DUF1127 domain-containing protein [Chromatiales bacterium]|nr:DUF1127 domain-containing protein [Chromatiales bacterium]